MPMEAMQSVVPGMHLGCSGFSSKPTIRPWSSTSSTPYWPAARAAGTRITETVRLASQAWWNSRSRR